MNELVALLFEALRSPHGLALSTDDPARLRQKLYPMRAADPALEPISFVIPAVPGELWLVKRPDDAQN